MPTKLAPANSHTNPAFVAAMEEDMGQQAPITVCPIIIQNINNQNNTSIDRYR